MKDVVDLMLDLETLGTGSNACIFQLSAVPFKLNTGELSEVGTFNMLIDPTSSSKAGGKIDGDTVQWWFSQDKDLVQKIFVNAIVQGQSLEFTLNSFSAYVEELKQFYKAKTVQIWGNGIAADNVWLNNAYKSVNLKYPVTFRDDMDVRTLVRIGKEFDIDMKDKIPFEGQKHNAIDDCRHQIKYLCAIYNAMFNRMHSTQNSSIKQPE